MTACPQKMEAGAWEKVLVRTQQTIGRWGGGGGNWDRSMGTLAVAVIRINYTERHRGRRWDSSSAP